MSSQTHGPPHTKARLHFEPAQSIDATQATSLRLSTVTMMGLTSLGWARASYTVVVLG